MPIATVTVLNTEVHTGFARELTANRAEKCAIFWKIGRQLNLEYGAPDSNYIPGRDMEKLTDLYQVSDVYVSAFRRFAAHPDSDTVTKSRRVIREYRGWTNILVRFLRGLSPDAPVPGQTRPVTPAAGFVVPEVAVDGFAQRFGWSHAMAQKTMRELSRDTDWLVNVFATRARRDGHRPVSDA